MINTLAVIGQSKTRLETVSVDTLSTTALSFPKKSLIHSLTHTINMSQPSDVY